MGVIYGGKNLSKPKNIIGDNINNGLVGGGVSVVQGGTTTISVKETAIVACVADADIVLNNTTTTIDGYTLVDGDYILVSNQSDASENGIYEYNASSDMVKVTNSIILVNCENGTNYAETTWGQYESTGSQNWAQIDTGGGGGTNEIIFIDRIYRNNSLLPNLAPVGETALLVNQTNPAENGYYVSNGSSFVQIATDVRVFIAKENTLTSIEGYEIWIFDTNTDNYVSLKAFKKLAHNSKSGNIFVSNYNTVDTDRNINELGRFQWDGQYLEAPIFNIGTAQTIFTFANTLELIRISSTVDNEVYENMQLKCYYRIPLWGIEMFTGFTLSIQVNGTGASILPAKSLLQLNYEGWSFAVWHTYVNFHDYSAPITIIDSGGSPGAENWILQGEFFIDMGTDATFIDWQFILESNDPMFPFTVGDGAYIDWRICNMRNA